VVAASGNYASDMRGEQGGTSSLAEPQQQLQQHMPRLALMQRAASAFSNFLAFVVSSCSLLRSRLPACRLNACRISTRRYCSQRGPLRCHLHWACCDSN
jgi:hypothetical protein